MATRGGQKAWGAFFCHRSPGAFCGYQKNAPMPSGRGAGESPSDSERRGAKRTRLDERRGSQDKARCLTRLFHPRDLSMLSSTHTLSRILVMALLVLSSAPLTRSDAFAQGSGKTSATKPPPSDSEEEEDGEDEDEDGEDEPYDEWYEELGSNELKVDLLDLIASKSFGSDRTPFFTEVLTRTLSSTAFV